VTRLDLRSVLLLALRPPDGPRWGAPGADCPLGGYVGLGPIGRGACGALARQPGVRGSNLYGSVAGNRTRSFIFEVL
jgi:hypothetical protein